MKNILLLPFLLITSLCLADSSPINSKNWMTHPEVKHIRLLYNEIEEAVKKGNLKKTTLPKECDASEQEGPSIQATLYKTPDGIAQKYELSGGSEDSTVTASYYYDKTGKLRFVFQSLRAVNGTKMETRSYFDENGVFLYKDERLKKGPGWTGGFPETIQSPKEHFTSLCK